ncbi:MAG TPA: biliverdin-producing heme oxygenase [Allosphingosinicella sp.]|nr:biliverdin-producing heme oxygenase [Allosphingosinicella sp.]
MIEPRRALRDGTLALHKRVDEIFSRSDLSRRGDYIAFLLAQAAALVPTEQALERAGAGSLLPGWEGRRRSGLLRADLFSLGAALPPPIATPIFSTMAEVWGGIYVLEGSRLGAALLKRSVAPALPTAFLGFAFPRAQWRELLQALDERLIRPAEIALATAASRCVFRLFEQAGLHFIRPGKRLS